MNQITTQPTANFNGLAPTSLEGAWTLAAKLSKSTIVPKHLAGKPEDIFSVILLGHELGLNPFIAMTSIYNIQGVITMKAQLMLAIAKKNDPGLVLDITQDVKNVSVTVRGTSGAGETFETTWDMPRAKAMGLTGKDNYNKQPLTMLRWRAITEVLRVVASMSCLGIYATEEIDGLELNKKPAPKSALNQAFANSPEPKQEPIKIETPSVSVSSSVVEIEDVPELD